MARVTGSILYSLSSILVCSMVGAPAVAGSAEQVIAYCAQDQDYAEPILREFTSKRESRPPPSMTARRSRPWDWPTACWRSDPHPRCDVFWGNEELRTRQLAAQDVFRATNGWAAFGYRSRRIVINTNRLSLAVGAALAARADQRNLARKGGAGLPAVRHHGHAFPRLAPVLGRRANGKPGAARWRPTSPSSWTATRWS